MSYRDQWEGCFMALPMSAVRLRMHHVRGHFVLEQVNKFTMARIDCVVCHGAFYIKIRQL